MARQMTEEQKKENAERLKAAREKKAAEKAAQAEEIKETPAENPAKDDTVELLKAQNQLLQRQMEELQRQITEMHKPQVIQVAADTERVHFLWQAEVADYNLVTFGPGGMYGSITGKTGTFSVPKNEMSRILDNRTRDFLRKRWLIVLDGMDDDEREALGINYQEGELLDRRVFGRMVNLTVDELREIYPKLCESHKEMVGRRFYEGWKNRNESVTREKVIALRDMTRNAGSDIQAFQTILQEMNYSEEE